MKDLSLHAKAYIIGTILVGVILFIISMTQLEIENIWATLALAGLASLALIFKVEGTTKRSHYNISFVVYSATFFLLGAPEALLVILISNLVEWVRHKYPWYIQSFNIGCYVITLGITDLVYNWINPSGILSSWQGVFSMVTAMVVFTLVNHLFVGIILWLARGENFKKSGIFDSITLTIDFTLLSMGAGAALVWTVEPVAIIFMVIPLYLIYNTLRVPALERQTEIDLKTGVYNHKYFEKNLEEELARANRFDHPLSVAMADLDLLRNINNTYGHLAGDEVLIGVANILKSHMRAYDTVARFGGEEFSILMPETTETEAFNLVEAIRKDIENAEFNVPTSVSPIKATMSFGIACRDSIALTPKEILHNSDTAVYHSKLQGRNRTFVYNDQVYQGLFQSLPEITSDEPTSSKEKISPDNSSKSGPNGQPEYTKTLSDNKTPPIAHPSPAWVINSFIICTAITAGALFLTFYDPFNPIKISSLLLFTIMVFGAEWFSQDIYIRNTAVSTSAAPILAGTILFGPVGAILLSLAFALSAFIKHKSPLSRLIFNFSNQLLACMIILVLINLLGIDFSVDNHLIQLIGYLAFSMVLYLSTTCMVTLAMHLSIGVSYKRTWQEQFSWLAPYYLVLGMISYALSFSYSHAGFIGALVITVPLMLLYFSQKQYIDRTKEIVKELKDKNVILKNSSDEITILNEGLLKTLAEVVDLRDPYVLGHSKQVTRYSVMIATTLGLDSETIERIRQAGLLHDIGKLGIPERILLKPSKLSAEEYQIVKEHASLGAEILRASPSLHSLIPIIRHHHERYDGKGYPDGLVGENIPIEARIVAVADAIEAMASDRPYRRAMTMDNILVELKENSGDQFDPHIITAFEQIASEEGNSLVINSARQGVNPRLHLNLDKIYNQLWQEHATAGVTLDCLSKELVVQLDAPATPPLRFEFTRLPGSGA